MLRLFIVLAIVVLTALAIHARSWLSHQAQDEPPVTPPQTQQNGAALKAEIITITPRGFEPMGITRSPGRFILLVENRSHLEEVTFRMDQENGDRLYEIHLPEEQPEWSQVIDLPPGLYVLSEANHSDWLSRLTITAK
jgi:hypothetical protein